MLLILFQEAQPETQKGLNMANPFYVPAKVRDELIEKLSETSINCLFCGELLKRPRDRNVDFINYDAENTFSVSNSVMCCADCMSARRRRPIGVFVDERFSELTVALAYISSLRTKTLADIFKVPDGKKKPAPVRAVPNTPLPVEWEDDDPAPVALTEDDVPRLSPDDPRLDPASAMFDEELYSRWVDD